MLGYGYTTAFTTIPCGNKTPDPLNRSLQTGEVAPDSTDVLSQNANGDWIVSGTDHTATTYDLAGETLTSTDERRGDALLHL